MCWIVNEEGVRKLRYLLNINSRTVHDLQHADGRCRLKLIAEENAVRFNTVEEAMRYLPKGRKECKKCTFCFGPKRDKNN